MQHPEPNPSDTHWVAELINWQRIEGRHHLPWQHTGNPYHVWLSEIMLQQTQVSTVTTYFTRFITRFPTIASLAQAPLDDVLALWSGLGYYARARNLHRCAQQLMTEFNGAFPSNQQQLETLAGIGRSTAAAIRSLAFNYPAAILDGNVKRVFTRLLALHGNPNQTTIAKQLWQFAEHVAPQTDCATYTQALMDLGATVCTRKNPQCNKCPIRSHCTAYHTLQVDQLPTPKPRKTTPEKHTHMLVITNQQGHILLEQQPSPGIWGGLWCFLMEEQREDIGKTTHEWRVLDRHELTSFKHVFTHFKLWIHPIYIQVQDSPNTTKLLSGKQRWFTLVEAKQAGIPKPVQTLLQQLDITQEISKKHHAACNAT